jgi:FKBP-type peptidyl-prolyl cis-trans isomerase
MKQNILIAILVIAIILVFGYILQDAMGNPIGKKTEPEAAQQTQPMDQPKEEVKIEEITEGTGQEVKSGDTVVMHYRGTLEDGTQFDSSYDRGEPFTTQIGVGQVIQGWDQGVPGMKVGGKRKLTIPASLGYGEQGAPPSIPPNATLIFEVELVGIQ